MKLDLVGLSGKAGSGKDHLRREIFMKRRFTPWAFAWPLKMAAIAKGFTYDDVFVAKPPEARRFLQEYGVRKREQDADFWVKMLDSWLRTLYYEAALYRFVITDVRFPNEAEYIRSQGGKLVRLEHGIGLPYPLAGTDMALHTSETALDDWTDWDAKIVNHADVASITHIESELWHQNIIHG